MDTHQFLTRQPNVEVDAGSARYYFHEDWYRATYLQGADASTDPWDHYVLVGERAGAMPHPMFCPTFYRQQSSENGGLALDHYARFGIGRMIHPHPLIRPTHPGQDLRWFEANDCPTTSHLVWFSDTKRGTHVGSLVLRYLLSTEDEWRFPNPLFDRVWYRAKFGAEIEPFGDPLAHYLAVGGHRGLPTGPHIVWESFLKRRPDLLLQVATPLEHALRHEPAYSFTFGVQRPEWLIVDALESGLDGDARAVLAAWSLTEIDEWLTIQLNSEPQEEAIHVLDVGGCLLTTNGVSGTLHGEPAVRHSQDRFILSDRAALVRRPHAPSSVDGGLLLIPSQSPNGDDIRSCVATALKTGATIVTDCETAAGLEAAAVSLSLHLNVVVPVNLTSVSTARNQIALGDDTRELESLPAQHATVCVVGRNDTQKNQGLTLELTSRGLMTLLTILPAQSQITIENPLSLRPSHRRELRRAADDRDIALRVSEAGNL